MTEKELVDHHVLCCQSSMIDQLVELYILESDAMYEKEVLEWWLITPFLAERLRNEDEVVVEGFDCHWWGRTVFGQAIYHDSVISDIVNGF